MKKETNEQTIDRMQTLIGLKIVDVGQVNGVDAVKLSNGTFLTVTGQLV